MRHDHRPGWLKRWMAARDAAYARRMLHPQFEAVGEGTRFHAPRAIEVIGPNITAGRHCHINAEAAHPIKLCVWYAGTRLGRITLGDYVLISPGVRIISSRAITIGTNTMIASGCYLSDSDWHGLYDRTAEPEENAKPVVLEENVWLGVNVIVGKGVTIGRDSVIGAGSVVTRDVPAGVVAAGNPATVRKPLEPGRAIRTRAELIGDGAALDALADRLDRAFLARNTTYGWLRAALWPRTTD